MFQTSPPSKTISCLPPQQRRAPKEARKAVQATQEETQKEQPEEETDGIEEVVDTEEVVTEGAEVEEVAAEEATIATEKLLTTKLPSTREEYKVCQFSKLQQRTGTKHYSPKSKGV